MNTRSMVNVRWWLALIFAVLIVVGAGVIYGSYSQRWGPPPDLVAAAAKLSAFPNQIGKWRLIEESPMEQVTIEMLECAGYVNRRYINQDTGQELSIAIIVGPPGPTAVHTPEICYSSRNYEIQSNRKKATVPASPAGEDVFWRIDFRSRNALANGLRVYYAWSRGDAWKAPASPRFELAAAPFLYKLQLATPIGPREQDDNTDPGRQFLEELNRSGWNLSAS